MKMEAIETLALSSRFFRARRVSKGDPVHSESVEGW